VSGSLCKHFFWGGAYHEQQGLCDRQISSGIVKRAVGVLVRDLRRPGPWWACSGGVPRGSATGLFSDLIFNRLFRCGHHLLWLAQLGMRAHWLGLGFRT
jgi:hypothetical protein